MATESLGLFKFAPSKQVIRCFHFWTGHWGTGALDESTRTVVICDPFDEGGESLHAKGQCSGGTGNIGTVWNRGLSGWFGHGFLKCHGMSWNVMDLFHCMTIGTTCRLTGQWPYSTYSTWSYLLIYGWGVHRLCRKKNLQQDPPITFHHCRNNCSPLISLGKHHVNLKEGNTASIPWRREKTMLGWDQQVNVNNKWQRAHSDTHSVGG